MGQFEKEITQVLQFLSENYFDILHEKDQIYGFQNHHLQEVITDQIKSNRYQLLKQTNGEIESFVGYQFQPSLFNNDIKECLVFPLYTTNSESLPLMLESIEREAIQQSCKFIYLEVPSSVESLITRIMKLNWKISGVFVRKETQKRTVRENDSLLIRGFTKEDKSFLLTHLTESIWGGLTKEEKLETNKENIRKLATQLYSPLLADALIAEWNHQLCGFSLIEKEVENQYTGELEAELIDTYVLEEFEGRGIAKALTSQIENILDEQGVAHIVGNISFKEQNGNRILQALQKEGWWNHSTLLYKKL